MSAALHLAAPEDAPKLLAMVEALHNELGLASSLEDRETALVPLLEGSPHGAVWLIGPRAAPVGYIAITFGWSLSKGGLEGHIDEVFVRETVRGRGVGTEVLSALIGELECGGLKALSVGLEDDQTRLGRICARLGFADTTKGQQMTRLCGSA